MLALKVFTVGSKGVSQRNRRDSQPNCQSEKTINYGVAYGVKRGLLCRKVHTCCVPAHFCVLNMRPLTNTVCDPGDISPKLHLIQHPNTMSRF